MLQQQNNQTEDATETYEQLIEVSPKNVVALNNLAWLYHEQNDGRATALARKAYELSPDNAAIADTYGWILFKSGQTEKSLPILEKAHELQPDSREIAMHLIEIYKALGRDADAKRALETIDG
jgi:tetratricopeptide (TPR) repeat protein